MENDQPIVKLLKLNHSDVLLLQQSLKNKIKMEIDPLADTLEDSAGNLETRHRVRPKPLGKEFKKQLSARVDRIEQLLELLLNNSDEVVNEDSGEDYE